jgi:hypothetical protein
MYFFIDYLINYSSPTFTINNNYNSPEVSFLRISSEPAAQIALPDQRVDALTPRDHVRIRHFHGKVAFEAIFYSKSKRFPIFPQVPQM